MRKLFLKFNRQKHRLVSFIMAISMLISMFQISNIVATAASVVTFANNSYPYGKVMSSTTVTLVTELKVGSAETVQWYQSTEKNGTYEAITGANNLVYTFNPSFSTTFPKNWFKCYVNGKFTYPVQLVQATMGTTTSAKYQINVTKVTNSQWYISNGTVAYSVFSEAVFDAIGKYTDTNNNTYWINTSYGTRWEINNGFKQMRVSFNDATPSRLIFDVDLKPTQSLFSFGSDVMLGNYEMYPGYTVADSASLKAVYTDNILQQIQMVGAATVDTALMTDPAFVLLFDTEPSAYWLGNYSSRQHNVYNTNTSMPGTKATANIGSQNVVSEVAGIDSGMTASYNVAAGGNVKLSFSIGSVKSTGAVAGAINYLIEKIEKLEKNTEYEITYNNGSGNTTVNVVSDANGCISLVGTDKFGVAYNIIGKTITLKIVGSSKEPLELEIVDRPDAPSDPSAPDTAAKPEDIDESDVVTSQNTIIITKSVAGQEYSIDGGSTWIKCTSADTPVEFTGLTPNQTVTIITRISASTSSPASLSSAGIQVKTQAMLENIGLNVIEYTGSYDGNSHSIIVSVNGLSDYLVEYSTSAGANYSTTKPTYTNAGEYTVYYRVTKDGYYPAYGSAHVNITKLTPIVAVTGAAITYGQKLSDSVLNGQAITMIGEVSGTFSWLNGDSTYPQVSDSNVTNYTAIFTPDDTQNYNSVQKQIKIIVGTVAQNAPTTVNGINETVSNKGDGRITGVTSAMEYRKSDQITYTPITETTIDNLAKGTYYVRYKGDLNHNPSNYVAAIIQEGPKLNVSVPSTQTGYTLTSNLSSASYNDTASLTFTLNEGYSKTTSFAVKANGIVLTLDSNGKCDIVVTQNTVITVEGVEDITNPTGRIEIGSSWWDSFLEVITFGLYKNENVQINILGTDTGSNIKSIEYYVSDEILTLDDIEVVTEWEQYTTAITETKEDAKKFIYYAKMTDNAGNITYLSSAGVTFDTSAPTISGVTNTQTYYTTQLATVADVNIHSIKLDGNNVTNPVTLLGNMDTDYHIQAVDKAGNETSVTVTMKPISDIYEDIISITTDNVKSTDFSVINAVKLALETVDVTNATESEQMELTNQINKCNSLLLKISATSDEIDRIDTKVDSYSVDTVKSSDKAGIEALAEDINDLLDTENLTTAERQALESQLSKCNSLLAKINDIKTEKDRIDTKVNSYSVNTVKSTDKADIEALIEDINYLLDTENLTTIERQDLDSQLQKCGSLLSKIEETKIKKDRVDTDVDGYFVDTVKSSDKAEIEALAEDINDLLDTENLTTTERQELLSQLQKCGSLLSKIETITTEKERIDTEADSYSVDTVKSADKAEIEALAEDINDLLDTENLTNEERLALENQLNKCGYLLSIIQVIKNEIERIDTAVDGYSLDTVKSSDEADIEKLKTDINNLLATNNLTTIERQDIENKLYNCISLLSKIETITTEKERIDTEVDGYSVDTVKSSDKAEIEALAEDINDLLDTENLTNEERQALENQLDKSDSLLSKIQETKTEIERIDTETDSYSVDTVKSSDKAEIEALIKAINDLLDTENLTTAERQALESQLSKCNSLLAKINDIKTEKDRIDTKVNSYSVNTVKSTDKADIEALIEDINDVLGTENLTNDERQSLENQLDKCNNLLSKIEETKNEKERIDTTVNGYSTDTVKSSDKDDILELVTDINKLLEQDNLTTAERQALEIQLENLNSLLSKIGVTITEKERIDIKANSYSVETVKSSDKAEIETLKEDINNILETQNLTAVERQALGSQLENLNSLLSKIEATKTEKERIDTSANEYAAETVKSTDKADITKLVEDTNKLLGGSNITTTERQALESHLQKFNSLLSKIEATKNEKARIDTKVNGYSVDTVKSTDKADVTKLLQDTDELLSESNLTENERKSLLSQKDKVVALLDKIEKAKTVKEDAVEELPDFKSYKLNIRDKVNLKNAKADIEQALDNYNGNYSDEELDELKEKLAHIDTALAALSNVETVQGKINILPKSGKVSEKDYNAILKVKKAYDALSDKEKKLVDADALMKALEAMNDDKKTSDLPKTGENSGLAFWMIAMAFSTFGFFGAIKLKKKEDEYSN